MNFCLAASGSISLIPIYFILLLSPIRVNNSRTDLYPELIVLLLAYLMHKRILFGLKCTLAIELVENNVRDIHSK